VVAVVEGDKFYVGIDLADKKSNYSFLSLEGKVVEEGAMATTQTQIDVYFSEIPIHPPDAIRKILDCLGLPSRPPPISSAALEDDADELQIS